jgi:hypothetical protein
MSSVLLATQLALTLVWEAGAWAGHEVMDAVPLPARTLEALAAGGVAPPRRYRLDGFDIGEVDPLPLPFAALAAAEVTSVAAVVDRPAVPGLLVEGITRAGSNRQEAGALLLRGPGQTVGSVRTSGPVIQDRLWYAATLEGGDGPRGLARLTWQASPRHKLGWLWVEAGSRGRLLGFTWESLLSNNLVSSVRIAGGDRPQASLRVEHFSDGPGGAHALFLGTRGSLAEPPAAAVFLEDRWRPLRHLTVVPALAWSGGLVPGLALAWDATRDGRTVVRASASRRWPRLSAGFARELPGAVVLSLDWLERTAVLGLRRREGGPRFDLAYARPLTAADPHQLRAGAGLGWTRWLTLGALLTCRLDAGADHARQMWAGLRARTELGPWLGFPLAVSIDALGLPARADVRLAVQSGL